MQFSHTFSEFKKWKRSVPVGNENLPVGRQNLKVDRKKLPVGNFYASWQFLCQLAQK